MEINISGSVVRCVTNVRNLGGIYDREMKMIYQVNDTIKRSNYAVRGIRKIKPYVSLSVRKTLVVSLVLSRIDFLNSLYSSLNRKDVRRLDVMLNNSARLITGTNPRASITPVLNSLHWLKIEYRIKYKLCIFVHKSVHLGCVPTYISELFTVNENPVRLTRLSCDRTLVIMPRFYKKYGQNSYQMASIREWNSLPKDIRDFDYFILFKKQLKTHLFRICYAV